MKKIKKLEQEKTFIVQQITRTIESLRTHAVFSHGYKENRVLLRYYENRLQEINYCIEQEKNKLSENAYLNSQ